MDREVIEQKLESLRRCLQRIRARCPATVVELAQQLKKAVGFRNIAVHSYEKIDWAIVHSIAHDHLDTYEAFPRAVLK